MNTEILREYGRRSRSLWCGFLVLLQLGTAGVPLPVAAQTAADPESPGPFRERGIGEPFNPKQCKTGDKRYVYWAARDQVFRFRFDPAQPVYARAPMDGYGGQPVMGLHEIPPAPNPEEPEGCYGSPLRGGTVPYLQKHAATLFEQLAGRPKDIATGAAWSRGYFALPRRLQADDQNDRHRKRFLQKRNCSTRSHGITECLWTLDASPDDWHVSRVIRLAAEQLGAEMVPVQDIYALVLGEVDASRGYVLSSGFDLFASVRLLENFRIKPHELVVLPAYYRGLIGYLAAAHLPTYRWDLEQHTIP